jgi:osmotically-inducible protein OsmY
MQYDQQRRQTEYQDESDDRPRRMGQGGQRGLAKTGQSDPTSRAASGGDWQGFVVPYRYYGPGYAGVGYYAVYYQGDSSAPDDETERGSTGFDQRPVKYGQGQGTGAAWRSQSNPSPASRGGFAGRGPKGYRRSDERIREEINDRLMDHDELDASDIEVAVKDGVATLTGTVDDRDAKRLAGDIAEGASGVHDVMNQLKIGMQERQTRTDRPMSGSTASRGSGSRSGAGSRASSGAGTRTGSDASSGARQPVGSGIGGATDGGPANGSTRG